MKKHLAMTLVLLFCFALANAQTDDILTKNAKESSYELFMKKKQTNKTVGLVMATLGPIMIVGGVTVNISGGIVDNDTTNNSKGLWLSYIGGATTMASIPFFISAGSNKRKAKLAIEQEVILAPLRTFETNQIAISVKIDLD